MSDLQNRTGLNYTIYTAPLGSLSRFVSYFRPDNHADMMDHTEIARRYERIKARNPSPNKMLRQEIEND